MYGLVFCNEMVMVNEMVIVLSNEMIIVLLMKWVCCERGIQTAYTCHCIVNENVKIGCLVNC